MNGNEFYLKLHFTNPLNIIHNAVDDIHAPTCELFGNENCTELFIWKKEKKTNQNTQYLKTLS